MSSAAPPHIWSVPLNIGYFLQLCIAEWWTGRNVVASSSFAKPQHAKLRGRESRRLEASAFRILIHNPNFNRTQRFPRCHSFAKDLLEWTRETTRYWLSTNFWYHITCRRLGMKRVARYSETCSTDLRPFSLPRGRDGQCQDRTVFYLNPPRKPRAMVQYLGKSVRDVSELGTFFSPGSHFLVGRRDLSAPQQTPCHPPRNILQRNLEGDCSLAC